MGHSMGKHRLVQAKSVPGRGLGIRVISSAGVDDFLICDLLLHTQVTRQTYRPAKLKPKVQYLEIVQKTFTVRNSEFTLKS